MEGPSPEVVRALREDAERRLSAEDFAASADSPMSAEELAGIVEQIECFLRRYPTAIERLRSSRLAYARARLRMPKSLTVVAGSAAAA